ncbi:MAG: hypothetical protein CSA68_06415 [Rhodobacterales bacterium]|nr:MAG: hypothetical protein CSA68_06415 [Rhodobacterales bacterium]
MIPAWKLKRELLRLGQQLQSIPEALWEPAAQRKHDAAFAAGFKVYQGQQAQAENIAILLLYQPKGISQSTVQTCQHLRSHGYAVFAISNTPLSSQDIALLQGHCWRIMERPNFGYDFGGYRDGIRQLWHWQVSPQKLLILNDSIWFPLYENCDLLEQLDKAEADMAGCIMRFKGDVQFLESYCYLIRGAVFASDVFRRYWQDLKLTSNKYKVIRRGERGHSEALRHAGFQLRPVYETERFLQALQQQSNAFLRKNLRYAAYCDLNLRQQRDQLMQGFSDSPEWRQAVFEHIDNALQRGQAYSSYPYAMTRLFHYPVLKKSNDQVAKLWRIAYLEAVDAGDLEPPAPAMLSEIRQKVDADRADGLAEARI